jgi:hypothetical protein
MVPGLDRFSFSGRPKRLQRWIQLAVLTLSYTQRCTLSIHRLRGARVPPHRDHALSINFGLDRSVWAASWASPAGWLNGGSLESLHAVQRPPTPCAVALHRSILISRCQPSFSMVHVLTGDLAPGSDGSLDSKVFRLLVVSVFRRGRPRACLTTAVTGCDVAYAWFCAMRPSNR